MQPEFDTGEIFCFHYQINIVKVAEPEPVVEDADCKIDFSQINVPGDIRYDYIAGQGLMSIDIPQLTNA